MCVCVCVCVYVCVRFVANNTVYCTCSNFQMSLRKFMKTEEFSKIKFCISFKIKMHC